MNGMFSIDSVVATRRETFYSMYRGLKPTAKVMRPLRVQNIAALTAVLDEFETADAAQAEGQQDTVGATAGIAQKIDEGMDAEKYLDAIMSNVYRDNPVKRAQWKTARHVKRAPQPPPPPTP